MVGWVLTLAVAALAAWASLAGQGWLTRPRPPGLVIRPCGDLDLAGGPRLPVPKADRVDGGLVVVDLSGVEFCDLAGLRRLAHVYGAYTDVGMQVRVVGARPPVRRLARTAALAARRSRGDDPS